ncbi:arginase family protein [Aliagarivorans marinus]|uniref:arginase family protein n=1 Tax=Aliagarivorans marinus TaxID=561965 RepID=UPI000427EA5B|nr:arginase family protein [Aliagarivorans marinus]
MVVGFDVIGAPLNQFGSVCSEDNPAQALRRGDGGLDEWLAIRRQRWGADIRDCGDVAPSAEVSEYLAAGDKLAALDAYSAQLKAALLDSFSQGRRPITIGGDHAIAVASLQAVLQHFQVERGEKVALVWVDAHADCNDDPEGNLHGKPLTMLMNRWPKWQIDPELALRPEQLFYVGVRDIGPNELATISEHAISWLTMSQIEEQGIAAATQGLLQRLEQDFDHIYLSFDYDALDGAIFRACATPDIGGLSAREALYMVSKLTASEKFIGAEFVEYLPERDVNGVSHELKVKLIDTAMGFGPLAVKAK